MSAVVCDIDVLMKALGLDFLDKEQEFFFQSAYLDKGFWFSYLWSFQEQSIYFEIMVYNKSRIVETCGSICASAHGEKCTIDHIDVVGKKCRLDVLESFLNGFDGQGNVQENVMKTVFTPFRYVTQFLNDKLSPDSKEFLAVFNSVLETFFSFEILPEHLPQGLQNMKIPEYM